MLSVPHMLVLSVPCRLVLSAPSSIHALAQCSMLASAQCSLFYATNQVATRLSLTPVMVDYIISNVIYETTM